MPEKLINLTKEHVRLFSVKDWPKYRETEPFPFVGPLRELVRVE